MVDFTPRLRFFHDYYLPGKVRVKYTFKKEKISSIMQSNSSSSASPAPLTAPSVCEDEERDMLKLDSPAGALSNLATYNLSLNCWLHILSKESSLELHGDTANLAVGVEDFTSKATNGSV